MNRMFFLEGFEHMCVGVEIGLFSLYMCLDECFSFLGLMFDTIIKNLLPQT